MVATPLKEALLKYYAVAPTYLGPHSAVHVATEHGKRVVEVNGSMKEVVVATAADIAASSFPTLAEGVYLVGTGNTGAAATFFTLGATYFSIITMGALSYRVPADGWLPPAMAAAAAAAAANPAAAAPAAAASTSNTATSMISQHHVHIDDAHKTPQFWGLWTCLCMNVTAGIGVIGVAKTMMTDMFGASVSVMSTEHLPAFLHSILGVGANGHISASVLAANYVFAISVFNMMGRLGWASVSDYIGRRNTYFLFFAGGIPLYLAMPHIATMEPGLPTLAAFYGLTMVIFRCVPALVRSLYSR